MKQVQGSKRWIHLMLLLLFASICALCVTSPGARSAGPWYVATTGDDANDCLSPASACETIGGALAKAYSGDTIHVTAGTYVENLTIVQTVRLVGAGSASTIISGATTESVIDIGGADAVEISGVTITNGGPWTSGGAIYSSAGSLMLIDCRITENSAVFGGGIYAYGDTTLINTTVANNTATSGAGGVYVSGNLTVRASTVTQNSSTDGDGGGIVHSFGSLIVEDSTVSNNTARAAGGISTGGPAYISNGKVYENVAEAGSAGGIRSIGDLILEDSKVYLNESQELGGGIYNSGALTVTKSSAVSSNTATESSGGGIYNSGGTVAILEDSTIEDNSARQGGGVYSLYGTLYIHRSTVKGNTADLSGGGIVSFQDTSEIKRSVIQNNTAQMAGGISHSGGRMTIENSTISNNTAQGNGGSDGRGGGISSYVGEQLTILNSRITGNRSRGGGDGGGVECHSTAELIMYGNTISGNTAEGDGAGLALACPGRVFGNSIADNTVPEGFSSWAGGVYVSSSGLSLNMNCIVGNSDWGVHANTWPKTDATANWWGTSTDPGDSVSLALYEPWLVAAPFDCTIQPPAAPSHFPEPNTVDLSVARIEVVQVSMTDDAVLIAGKPSLVRIYLQTEGVSAVPYVTARLTITDARGIPHEVSPIFGEPTAVAQGFQGAISYDLSETLNFLPDAAWLEDRVTFQAKADPFDLVQELNEDNNTLENHLDFMPAKAIRIAYVPIEYRPTAHCNWSASLPDQKTIETGHRWAEMVFPTARVVYERLGLLEWDKPLREGVHCMGNRIPQNEERLLETLSRKLSISGRDADFDYVFGWLPPNATGGGKAAGIGTGRAAHGDAYPTEGQRTLAHEVGHLLGRRHTNTVDNLNPGRRCRTKTGTPPGDWKGTPDQWRAFVDLESDWVKPDDDSVPPPFSTSHIQAYGLHISKWAVMDQAQTYDYMSYCGSVWNGDVWTSPFTYNRIYAQALQASGQSAASELLSTPQRYFVASGLVTVTGTASLDPVWVITSTARTDFPSSGQDYCVEARSGSGTVLSSHCFTPTFVDYVTGEAISVAGYSLFLPYPDGTAEIALKKGGDVLVSRLASTWSPEINVLSPNGGEIWNATGTYTITWSASDADGDLLVYSVLYSTDATHWVPLATDITEAELAVNAGELAGGTDARIRVLVSDGLNTSADDTDAPFEVGRKKPQVYILVPESDVSIAPNTPVFLRGYAYDLEDGTLSDGAMQWGSDLDGDLGSGRDVVAGLSAGEHVISLVAVDSDGDSDTQTVAITVKIADRRIYLPVVQRR